MKTLGEWLKIKYKQVQIIGGIKKHIILLP
jgi:hypothetical protein